MGIRFAVILCLVFVAYSFLVFNLYQLQVTHGEYFLAKAESQYALAGLLEARRGTIYFTDKNGDRAAAAITKDFPIIYAVPTAIEDARATAKALATLIGKEEEVLSAKLTKPNDDYELLLEKAPQAMVDAIDSLKMKGIYTGTSAKRFYPFESLAAHVLGFVGPSEKTEVSGHYGIEEFYEERLRGIAGEIQERKFVPPVPGDDIALTIDPNIQIEAERILDDLVGSREARGGGVIVADPRTGKILAMAGREQFDPNRYETFDLAAFVNPLTQKIYEPGSVVKVLTMAAGIDLGKITPETTYVDKGALTLNGRTITNFDFDKRGPYGAITMTNVLEHSVNTGAVFVMRAIGREALTRYFKGFGLHEKTGIDLTGEARGDLKRLNPKERDIAFATASYGQGVAVTPIELLTAISAIANEGKLMRPYLNAAREPEVIGNVIKAETARTVAAMMVSAVDTAEVAEISGYSLAGKTGTAFVPDFIDGGYTEEVINTYVGFGPASNPRFIVLLKLDEPKGAPVAALTVVPAFRDLAQFLLTYYAIPPDRLGQ